jgi:hypothetical protein
MIPILKWAWAFYVWCFNTIKAWLDASWWWAASVVVVAFYFWLAFR